MAASGWLAVSLLAFFALVDRDHVASFFSTATYADNSERLFYEHTEHELKLKVVVSRPRTAYAHFRDDVKAFVQENVGEWEADRPYWYNDAVLADVPDNMLTGAAGEAALRRKRGRRRKASVRRRNSVAGRGRRRRRKDGAEQPAPTSSK